MGTNDVALIRFRQWLEGTESLAFSSSSQYVSYVRSFLLNSQTARSLLSDPERFRRYAWDYDAQLSPKVRSAVRAALRHFLRFIGSSGGPKIVLDYPEKGREFRAASSDLRPLLEVLRSRKIPFARIPHWHWKDARSGPIDGDGYIHDTALRMAYHFPFITMQALCGWAGGGERALSEQPFIPFQPKGMTPMPAARLHTILRKH